MANTFSDVSSNNNYSNEFRTHKNIKESESIEFISDNVESYNRQLTIEDLEYNIAKVKNSIPDLDAIHYQMIKRMLESGKINLCEIFNKFFKECFFFPEQWRVAVIVPIPKPGKSHNKSVTYRPIALTTCLCKTFERMLNERLVEYLEMNNIFAGIQCGCRRNKSSIDHLVRLESEVIKAFAIEVHMLSVFFDLEKAYDMWRHGIIQDMHEARLK